jgi:acyl-CoA reductase-like NAD-dependent aldehyde dehydrogenase
VTAAPFGLIIFTGSPQKGKLVAQAAAQNLTPCILELGGKCPTIVDKDVNMDNAVLRIAQGRYTNAG